MAGLYPKSLWKVAGLVLVILIVVVVVLMLSGGEILQRDPGPKNQEKGEGGAGNKGLTAFKSAANLRR